MVIKQSNSKSQLNSLAFQTDNNVKHGEKTSIHFHETTFTCFTTRVVTPFMKKVT